jgi:hypothetical protein
VGDLHILPGTDRIDPEVLLRKAREWNLADAVIVGKDVDGNLCVGVTMPECGRILLFLALAERFVVDQVVNAMHEDDE